jgi:hypothetical protein
MLLDQAVVLEICSEQFSAHGNSLPSLGISAPAWACAARYGEY